MTEPVDFDRRFGGLRRLYGESGAQAIFGAHVAVVGLGGVGSWTAEALARSGVGKLTLIDFDHIAESNVNRQVHALSGTLGQSKISALAGRIADINPGCEVVLVDDFLTPDNGAALLECMQSEPGRRVALVDACDQAQAKTWMAAHALGLRWIHVMVGAAGGKRQAQQVEVGDLTDVTHDPLLAGVRQRLRKHYGLRRSGSSGVSCVFSREPVVKRAVDAACDAAAGSGAALNCQGYGSSVSVTATFGMVAAGVVLESLAAAGRTQAA